MANISDFTTCITLNSQPCMIGAALIDLNPDECNQGLCYYPFMANLDTCSGSCNTLDNQSSKICVPKKTKEVNLNIFSMITRINESET